MTDTTDNPWTTLRTTQAYDNPWIEVVHHEVLDPSGRPGIYGIVRFKNVAVGMIPVADDATTYLVGQYRYPLGRYSWEIPEGGSKTGDPLTDAQRELLEETGLSAANWTVLLELDLSNSVTDERAICYLATGLTAGAAHPDHDEKLEVRRVALATAFAMVERGEIRDAISVAALQRLEILARRGALPQPIQTAFGRGT